MATGNIFGIKFISGEEVIAKVSEATVDPKTGKSKVKLSNPALLGVAQGPDGRPSIGLADYLMLAEKKDIMIDEDHILYMYDPVNGMLNNYNQMFGSKILIPDNNIKSSILSFPKRDE